jgi:hypothetical protein
MKLNKRKCKECKKEFQKRQPLQYVCSTLCAIANSRKAKDKKDRADTKTAKISLMTHSNWLQLLQKVFNTYIRMRDKDLPCISCGTRKDVMYAAGHFWPTTYQYLRFNEDNVHKQCNKNCNMMKSGNLLEYRPNLIERIGLERVEELDSKRHNLLDISIPEIQDKIKEYKQKIKDLK